MPELLPVIYGSSPAVREMLRLAQAYAYSSYPILILGAPGTGKSALARHLHQLSGRPREKFVRCPIPGLPDGISQTELLGSGRGAFTGAVDRAGLVEGVTGGTLFLDELGLASPGLQGVLLALFDDPVVRRLGQERDRPVNVRYIAATNSDLEGMAAAGTFRPDLLGRFGHFKLRVPSLVERRDEILPLVERFLVEEYAGLGTPWLPVLGRGVAECLLAAPWGDNIRELR
ncbi:MAG: sigma-54-dependent transcriptional regulator, partial [Gemmatimonadales bacterium]